MESGGKGVDLEQWSRHAEWGEGRRSRTVELTSKLCVGAFIRIRKLSRCNVNVVQTSGSP